MEWLTSIFGFIFEFLFGSENSDGEREGGLVMNLWDGAKSVGSGILDFFSSDKYSIGEKATVGLGAAYLLAPDATSKVVSNAVDGITNTATNVGSSVMGTVGTFIKNYWLYILGGFIAYKLITDDD